MVDVSFASPAQRPEIEAFMHSAFPRAKWGRDGWTRLLASRWGGPDGEFAVQARDQGKLVGVMGMNDSLRHTPRGWKRYRNLTSWYVLKSHRGMGLGETLMHRAMADKEVTSTNLTSAKAALPLVHRIGFLVLDDMRITWRKRAGTPLDHSRDPLHDAPLNEVDARVLRDHEGLDLAFFAIDTPEGLCTLVLSIKQKDDAYVTHEVVYVGQPALLARYAQSIADTVLPDSPAVFSVDSRLVPGNETGTAESIEVPRFYKGTSMRPAEIDHMYSEVVLMGMKLY